MHQNVFDEQIKQALENLPKQVSPFPSGWERLQQRLEQEGLMEDNDVTDDDTYLEEQFDEAIKEKITHYSLAPYFQHRHWLQLAEKLDEQDERIVKLYKHKLAEISLILLFFFAISNILDSNNSDLDIISTPLLKRGTNHISHQTAQNHSNHNQPNNNATNLPTIEIKGSWTISNAAKTPKTNFKKASLDYLKKIDKKIEPLPLRTLQKITPNKITERPIALMPTLLANRTMAASEIRNNDVAIEYVKPIEKKYWTSVGLIAIFDINQIFTPSEYFFGKEIEEYTTYALSGGGGFTLSTESKSNSIELGLLYNTKRYHPKKLSIISASDRGIVFEEKLRNVQLNMIQVPINYRYKFLKRNNTSYFMGVGTSINMITQANYDNDRQYLVPEYAMRMMDESLSPSPIEKAKKFNAGLLEGGVLQENIFLTALATVGFEYKLTNNVSLFNQASYQRHITLKGIGANNNSFHAYSLWVGLRRNF
jgi:hypothetical protein